MRSPQDYRETGVSIAVGVTMMTVLPPNCSLRSSPAIRMKLGIPMNLNASFVLVV